MLGIFWAKGLQPSVAPGFVAAPGVSPSLPAPQTGLPLWWRPVLPSFGCRAHQCQGKGQH